MSYYPYCACSHCWFKMARSAYSPSEFVQRARKFHLTTGQQKVIDEIKLKLWNGEIAS